MCPNTNTTLISRHHTSYHTASMIPISIYSEYDYTGISHGMTIYRARLACGRRRSPLTNTNGKRRSGGDGGGQGTKCANVVIFSPMLFVQIDLISRYVSTFIMNGKHGWRWRYNDGHHRPRLKYDTGHQGMLLIRCSPWWMTTTTTVLIVIYEWLMTITINLPCDIVEYWYLVPRIGYVLIQHTIASWARSTVLKHYYSCNKKMLGLVLMGDRSNCTSQGLFGP